LRDRRCRREVAFASLRRLATFSRAFSGGPAVARCVSQACNVRECSSRPSREHEIDKDRYDKEEPSLAGVLEAQYDAVKQAKFRS